MARCAALLTVLAIALGACAGGGDEDGQRSSPATPSAERSTPRGERAGAVSRTGLEEHLRALQRIAVRNGGNRAAGSAGDRASERYVVARLREAGWRVRLQRVRFPFYRERSSSLRVAGRELRPERDFRTLEYSGAGRASGPARLLGSGCAAADFSPLEEGEVAVVSRGECRFRVKARNAERGGAGALLVADDAVENDRAQPTLGGPGVRIPVLLVQGNVSVAEGVPVGLGVDAQSGRRVTNNVIAESAGGGDEGVVMAGAHLDSVPAGPGLNDNGSGVAALLEMAEALGPRPPGGHVRLGFWAAEELGLIGSRRYVRSLNRAERRRIVAYINLDMVGSPNAVPAVYTGAAPAVERVLRRAVGRRPENQGSRAPPARRIAGERIGGASDHASFAAVGIPIGGLYTGSAERGPGGERRDPCYHRACDSAANVDRRVLREMARAAAKAVRRLSAG